MLSLSIAMLICSELQLRLSISTYFLDVVHGIPGHLRFRPYRIQIIVETEFLYFSHLTFRSTAVNLFSTFIPLNQFCNSHQEHTLFDFEFHDKLKTYKFNCYIFKYIVSLCGTGFVALDRRIVSSCHCFSEQMLSIIISRRDNRALQKKPDLGRKWILHGHTLVPRCSSERHKPM